MPEEKKKLGEILLEAGVIDKFQLKSALAEQNKWGGRLGNHLVQMGILSEDLLVKALSKQLKIPNLDLSQMMVTGDVLELVPHEIAEKFHLVPVAVKKIANKRTLIVAMSDPTNLDAVDELQFRTGHIIKPAVAGDTAIELAIRRYYYGEVGPQRVAGQPIEFDPGRPSATPAVTNVPSAGVPVPPENTFALGEDPAPAPVPPAAPEPEIPEASLADLGMEVQEPTAADPGPVWPPPAADATSAPAWAPPAEVAPASIEPEPYDPAAISPADPEPAYAEPTYAEPTAAEPAYAEPAYAEPTYAEPTYADAPVAEVSAQTAWSEPAPAIEPEPATLEPTYADPLPETAPADADAAPAEPAYEPTYADASVEPAPAVLEDATAAPEWNGGNPEDAPVWPAAEPPYPADEPTVPADEGYAAAAVVAEPEPAPQPAADWAEPAADPVWAEPEPAAAPHAEPEPAPAMIEAMTDTHVSESAPSDEPVWPEPPVVPEPEPVAETPMALEPVDTMEVLEPMEASIAPSEPSMDSVEMEPIEPGPAEAEVDRMEQVGAGWSAGDAVQTFQGSTDGHPYEPTTPGEPTHAPAEETPLAADGGAAAATDVTHVQEPEPEPEPEPHANGNGASGLDATQPDYLVPADPLGGIPFDTAEGRAIRALCALLLEKGLLTADELASRLRTAVEGMGGGDGGEGHG